MREESFEELRSEIIGGITEMLPALEAGVAGIAVIIHYGGSLMASLAMHDSMLSRPPIPSWRGLCRHYLHVHR